MKNYFNTFDHHKILHWYEMYKCNSSNVAEDSLKPVYKVQKRSFCAKIQRGVFSRKTRKRFPRNHKNHRLQ